MIANEDILHINPTAILLKCLWDEIEIDLFELCAGVVVIGQVLRHNQLVLDIIQRDTQRKSI